MLKVLGTVTPKMLMCVAALVNAAEELDLGVDMVITAGRNGKHKTDSKHYTYEAIDFRTKHLSKLDKGLLVAVMRRRLGADYDVILEDVSGSNEHGHAEHDPK